MRHDDDEGSINALVPPRLPSREGLIAVAPANWVKRYIISY